MAVLRQAARRPKPEVAARVAANWDDPAWNQEGTPKEAVDAFLSIYAAKIKILHKDWLVWIQKIADPIWGL